MTTYLSSKAPLSICVDAESWQNYKSGVLKKNCGKQLDHCVMAVGYEMNANTPYWIIRNSWVCICIYATQLDVLPRHANRFACFCLGSLTASLTLAWLSMPHLSPSRPCSIPFFLALLLPRIPSEHRLGH